MKLIAAILILSAVPAIAADCRSVAGHFENQHSTATRRATIAGSTLTLSGTWEGQASPRRKLPCKALATGVYCERKFGPVLVTVMTNRKRMIETVTDPSGREIASFAYQCNAEMRMK